MKKQMIESQTPNGRCYLRLMCVLPSFRSSDPGTIEEAIVSMTLALGPNPKGLDVLHYLWNAEKILNDEVDSAIGLDQPELNDSSPVPISFIEKIMCAPYRFGFEDRGGVMHITYYLKDVVEIQDSDTEIETELGFASRYILQMMCNQGRHIGATEALDNIFDNFLEDEDEESFEDHSMIQNNQYFQTAPQPKVPVTPSYPIEHDMGTGLYDRDPVKRETQSRLEDVFNRMEQQKTKTPDPLKKSQDSELLERLMRMEERMNSVLSMKNTENVMPDDSSSNIGRYTKKFLSNGTVLSDNRIYEHAKGGTILAIREEGISLNVTKDVAVGFVRTTDMRKKENEQLKRIAPINGLANPFKSSRLNLLMHFHTAVENVMPSISNNSYLKMMQHIVNYKPKCASEEFAYQLIVRSFDMQNLVVLSNPFRLPFIEVGMQVTDSTLVKCFTLLRSEYKMLWFNEMKHLVIPKFHDEFMLHSANSYSKSSRSHQDSGTQKRASKERGSFTRSRGDRSTLSILR